MSEDWADYFRRYREKLAQDTDVHVPPVTLTVLEVDTSPSREGLGKSIRDVLAVTADWGISELHRSVVHVSDEFYSADSKIKPGQEAPEHRKGELKTPAHDRTYWWVRAAEPRARVGLLAQWEEGVTPKGGRSFKYVSALCADPLGMPTECFASYEPDANALRQLKDEPKWAYEERASRIRAEAERRDREYNDGVSWLNRRPLFKSAKDFTTWLAEACSIVERARTLQAA